MQLVHHVRGLGHRGDHVVREVARVRRGEADPLQALDLPGGAQQLGERLAVAQVGAVGVDVLAEQGHLDDALADQRLDLGEHVAGPAVLLLAAQRGDDAEGAGVVAADRDRDPGGVRGLPAGGQGRGEGLQGLQDLDLGLALDRGPLQQGRQVADVVRAEHHVDPGGLGDDGVAVLLGQAAADGDLHALVTGLDRRQLSEVAVQLVVRVLPHRAGVEDHQVGITLLARLDVPGVLQQPGEPLRVVDVHLAAVRDDLVALRSAVTAHPTRVRAAPPDLPPSCPPPVRRGRLALSLAWSPAAPPGSAPRPADRCGGSWRRSSWCWPAWAAGGCRRAAPPATRAARPVWPPASSAGCTTGTGSCWTPIWPGRCPGSAWSSTTPRGRSTTSAGSPPAGTTSR